MGDTEENQMAGRSGSGGLTESDTGSGLIHPEFSPACLGIRGAHDEESERDRWYCRFPHILSAHRRRTEKLRNWRFFHHSRRNLSSDPLGDRRVSFVDHHN